MRFVIEARHFGVVLEEAEDVAAKPRLAGLERRRQTRPGRFIVDPPGAAPHVEQRIASLRLRHRRNPKLAHLIERRLPLAAAIQRPQVVATHGRIVHRLVVGEIVAPAPAAGLHPQPRAEQPLAGRNAAHGFAQFHHPRGSNGADAAIGLPPH